MKKTDSKHRIKELIEYLGISQTEFCKRCGLNKSALSNYLNGDREPRQDKLSMIADAFDVDPAWLMGYETPMRLSKIGDTLSYEESKVISAYRSSSDEIQCAVCAVLGVKRGSESTTESISI